MRQEENRNKPFFVLLIRGIHQYYGILGFSLAIVTDKTYNAY